MTYELRGLAQSPQTEGNGLGSLGSLGYMATGDGTGLSAYELRGLGATGVAKASCPASNSALMPAGLSDQYMQSYPLSNRNFRSTNCNATNAVGKLCDKSAQPVLCYWAKTSTWPVKNFLGRPAQQSDWQAWADWTPSNAVPSAEAAATVPPGAVNTSTTDDTTFYLLLAGGVAAAGAAVWFLTRLHDPLC